MSFDWGRYVDLADAIRMFGDRVTAGDETLAEAAHRAAVSRAYYGVYIPCFDRHVAVWGAEPLAIPGKSRHTCLSISFENKAPHLSDPVRERGAKKIGQGLERLRKLRNDADYRAVVAEPGPARAAQIALKQARTIQGALGDV